MRAAIIGALLLLGCGEGDGPAPAATGQADVGAGDARAVGDAAAPSDLGLVDAAPDVELDAGPRVDSAPEVDAAPLPAELDAPGPYGVGFRIDEVTWQGPFGERTLRTPIWYPTRDTEGARARYINAIFRDGVFANAAPIEGPLPIMLFSHGSQGVAEQSFFLTEFFASHGWVVVSPDHPGNTLFDDTPPIYVQFELRPVDIGVALDHLLNLPAADPLAGRADEARVLMAGHSLGGYTALAKGVAEMPVDGVVARCAELGYEGLCEYLEDAATRYRAGFEDPRIDAIISMTPVWARVFDGGLDAMGRPVLLMTGDRDTTLPNEEEGDPIWGWLAHPEDIRVDVADAGHLSFSDLCSFLPPIEATLSRGCGPDFIEPERIKRIVKAWSLAFANRHVLGEARGADLLEGALQLDEAGRVSRR